MFTNQPAVHTEKANRDQRDNAWKYSKENVLNEYFVYFTFKMFSESCPLSAERAMLIPALPPLQLGSPPVKRC